MPLAQLGNAALGELDDDVHGLAVRHVAGQEGADAVGVLHPAGAVFMDLDGAVDVQTVGVYDLLGGGVDAEGLILFDDLFRLFLFVTAVHAESLVHHGHALGEVREEDLVAEAIVQINTVVTVVNIAELPHYVEVAFEDTADVLLEGDELVGHGAEALGAVFHCKPNIARTGEDTRPLLRLIDFLHGPDDHLLVGETQSPAGTHVSESQAVGENLHGLVPRAAGLKFRIIPVDIALKDVHQLGNGREDGHLPHDGGEPLAPDLDVQVSLLVLRNVHLLGVEAVTFQECEVPQREEVAAVAHVVGLLLGADDVLHPVDLLLKQGGEALGIYGAVSVEEGILHLGTGILHQDVVLAGEGIKVIVREMCYYLSHRASMFSACKYRKNQYLCILFPRVGKP